MMRRAMLYLILTVLALVGGAAVLGIAAGQMHEADYMVEKSR